MPPPPRGSNKRFLLSLALAAGTLWVFWPLGNHGFIDFDDDVYVYENPRVKEGLTIQGVIWAFTTLEAGFWHPLTWLSHMSDCALYGLNAGGHHLTNVLLHAAGTLLLFLALERMTRARWRSGLVAALFALHPLHVESVAWVAERKDVLSAFFWMLTLWAYARYAEQPGRGRYLAVLGFFVLGLLSKPMLVTLPCVMLLLDYWPLGRFSFPEPGRPGDAAGHPAANRNGRGTFPPGIVLEKIPFFALAAIFGLITFVAEAAVGAVSSLDLLPLKARVANALVTYVIYMGKTVWPHPLAVFYPHPGMLPLWQAAGAGILLAGASILVVCAARRFPYLPVGWFWYLGTLVPVIGLVQVGPHGMADRYTYVPLVGLFILLAWSVPDSLAGWRRQKVVLAICAGLLLSAFTVVARMQIHRWQDSITLFTHTLQVTKNNAFIHNNMGVVLAGQGRAQEAFPHYAEALRIKPNDADIHNNLGGLLAGQGKTGEAMAHYAQALRINPNSSEAHNNLGTGLAAEGKTGEAMAHYAQALRINPNYADAHYNLGNALQREGRTGEAIRHFREALRINPSHGEAHNNLGTGLAAQGKTGEAMAHYAQALRINPNYADAHYNLGHVLAGQGKAREAAARYAEALRINPDFAGAHYGLGNVLAGQGKTEEAVAHYTEALRINPQWAGAHNNLGNALARQGKTEEAVAHYTQALRADPNYAGAHYNLGNALADLGMSQKAIAHYREALRINPNYAEAHNNLGNALARQGKTQEARVHFAGALRINPDYAEAHYNLGNALQRQGRAGEAIPHYRQALRLKPDFAEARFSSGLASFMTGNRDAALEEYKILRGINPQLANALYQEIFK